MKSYFTESGSGGTGNKEMIWGPNWAQVIHRMFTKQEIELARKKPFATNNLPVLQRLLAIIECVKVMTEYGFRMSWAENLVKFIHNDPDLHTYQSALARDRKKCELYQLNFDSDGLVIKMENSGFAG